MKFRAVAALCIAVACGLSTAEAGTISLGWSPVSHNDLAGYRVYHDTVPGNFGNSVDVGLQLSVTLNGLTDCTTHEVAVKAYDSQDRESPTFSNIVSGWPRPEVGGVSPSQVERNSQVQLTIDGINFQSGAQVKFSNPGITASGVSVNACDQLVVTADVSGAASLGAVTVRVVNPDQVYGETAGLLTVAGDGTAPTISSVGVGAVGATSATISWTTDEPADSRVEFRRQGETGYQATPLDPTLTTAHSVTLTGLWPDTTYQFHVASTDGDGNQTSSAPDDSFLTQSSSFSYLRLEAEHGTVVAPVSVQSAGDVYGSKMIQLPQGQNGTAGNPAGQSLISFNVPYDGDWTVWVRARATDSNGVSWYEGVDGASLLSLILSAPDTWEWVEGRTYTLSAGLHVLRIGGRRGEARADRAIVTDDPSFIPTESPAGDVTPPAAVGGLAGSPGDNSLQLSWTNPPEAGPLQIVVRYREDLQFPLGPGDGLPLVDKAATPGAADGVSHLGLVNGTTYSYAVFAIDFAGNVSDAATVQVTPLGDPPPGVENLHRTDTEP